MKNENTKEGFTRIPNSVLYDKSISPTSKYIYIKMCGFRDKSFNKTYISTLTKVTLYRVNKSLTELVKANLLLEPIEEGMSLNYRLANHSFPTDNYYKLNHNEFRANHLTINEKVLLMVLSSIDFVPTIKWLIEVMQLSQCTFNRIEKRLKSLNYTVKKKRKKRMKNTQMPLFGDQRPIKTGDNPIKKKIPKKDSQFITFFKNYPRITAVEEDKRFLIERQAKNQWTRLTAKERDLVFTVLPQWAQFCQAREDAGGFITWPSNWLKKKMFEEDPKCWVKFESFAKENVSKLTTEMDIEEEQRKYEERMHN